jgi:hypothetical protein
VNWYACCFVIFDKGDIIKQASSDLLTIQKTKNDTTMKQNESIDETKIIIVSDVHSSNQSIIPFGLDLAKYLQSEVDIIRCTVPYLIQWL